MRLFLGMLAAEALHAIQLWVNRPDASPPSQPSPVAQEGPLLPAPEDVRAAYGAAVDLIISEGEMLWSKFNALLVIHTILLVVSFAVLTSDKEMPWAARLLGTVVLPIVGVCLGIVWWLFMERSWNRYDYWIHAARELEGFMRGITVLSKGGRFADGGEVTLRIDNEDKHFSMSCRGRLLRVRGGQRWGVALFVIMYLAVLATALWHGIR
jgi:hypothetical protein